jgi:Flp pilus assembly pilin Flp
MASDMMAVVRGGRKHASAAQPVLNRGLTLPKEGDNHVALTFLPGFLKGARGTHLWEVGGSARMDSVRQFLCGEDGQDVVEYGLLIATIAIVVLVGISFFGGQIQEWFRVLAGRITTTGVS